MGQLTFGDPVPGQANSSEEPKIPTALDAIKTWANGPTPGTVGGGNIDTDNLKGTFLKKFFLSKTASGDANWTVAFGNGSFIGDNTFQHQLPVAHGLPSASTPKFIICIPALALSSGSTVAWAAPYGQYAAADSTNFYIMWQQDAQASTTGGTVIEFGFLNTVQYFFNYMAIGG